MNSRIEKFDRFDPNVMGGRPCIRGMRLTVGTLVGLVGSGHSVDHFLGYIPIWKERISFRL